MKNSRLFEMLYLLLEKRAITAGELAARVGDRDLSDADVADAAIHFALLSYAAGVAGNRCVSLLRERKGAGAKGKKEKERD